MKRFFALVLALIMALSLVACGGKKEEAPAETPAAGTEQPAETPAEAPFKIGFYGALTGSNALAGECSTNAAKLYIKQLNERGGLNGRQVEFVAYDDTNTPEEAVKCATKMVEVEKCDAVIAGFFSSCIIASGGVLNDAGIPFFIGGLSPALTSQGWTYVARTALNTNNNIPQLPGILKELGLSKIAILQSQDEYGTSSGKNMRTYAEDAGVEVTTTENYVSGDTDFSGQVNKIVASAPDAVFLAAPAQECGILVKQLRQYGWTGLVFGSELLNTSAMEIAGEAADYMMFAYPYVVYNDTSLYDESANKAMYDFHKAYEAEYGKPCGSDCGYRAWDAMVLLEEAVKRAGSTDHDAIMEEIYKINDVASLSGKIMDFSKEQNGDCMYEFNYYVIVDGVPITLEQWRATDDFKTYAAQQGWAV